MLEKVNLSVVLYNTPENEILNIINSFHHVEMDYTLYVIDNFKSNDLEAYFFNLDNIVYIHNPSNPGFGASHNIAIKESIKENVPFHFVINPDVIFIEDVITKMVDYMRRDTRIGMMMPQVLNVDGSVQYLPKLLPSPISLILRKLKKPKKIYENFINKYELRFVDKSMIYNTPILSGCFTLFRVEALKEIGIYDDRFFMYFEDWDLSRRMHQKFDTIYFPKVSVYHGYESGANKSKRLFKIFIDSARKYFNKWGWIFDKDRAKINNRTLNQFK